MSERGVIAIDRGVFDHECFAQEPFTEREAWMWLIAEASWKARTRRVGRVVVDLKRGQLAASVRFMADKWKWPNKDKVARFLERLRDCDMIATVAATGITVITICNYDEYQKVSLPIATAAETEGETQPRQTCDKTENIKTIETDGGGGRARGGRIEPRAYEIAVELGAICGHPTMNEWPPGWCGSPLWVQKCLNEGWNTDAMVAATRAVAKQRDGPIEHFKYLEKPLARAQAQHQAPLPKVEIPQQETIRGANQSAGHRPGNILDAAREMRRRFGGDEDRNSVLSLSKG